MFGGFDGAGVRGIVGTIAARPGDDHDRLQPVPRLRVAKAVETLKRSGVDGPYAIALGPRCYTGVIETTERGGYPVLQHLGPITGGPVVWAPAVDGAVVVSLRGGDFELIVGQDFSIGYLDHDAESVPLYLEESLTFRVLEPEAAVKLDPARQRVTGNPFLTRCGRVPDAPDATHEVVVAHDARPRSPPGRRAPRGADPTTRPALPAATVRIRSSAASGVAPRPSSLELSHDPGADLLAVRVGSIAASVTVSDIPIGSRPGWTLNTLMPYRLVSWARFSVSLATAAFDTEYVETSGHRNTPA